MGALRAANALAIVILCGLVLASAAALMVEPAKASGFSVAGGPLSSCICFTIL
jgi:hypothetical protein